MTEYSKFVLATAREVYATVNRVTPLDVRITDAEHTAIDMRIMGAIEARIADSEYMTTEHGAMEVLRCAWFRNALFDDTFEAAPPDPLEGCYSVSTTLNRMARAALQADIYNEVTNLVGT